jgi:hypothetical protein
MVELKRADVDVVAAHAATTAGLSDEDVLDSPPPGGDPLHGASRAAIEATPTGADVVGPPMARALARDARRFLAIAARVLQWVALQSVLGEPVADARVRQSDLLADLADRHPALDELEQRLTIDAAARSVLRRVLRPYVVLLHPEHHR